MSPSFVSIGLGAMGIGVAQCLIDRGWDMRGAVSHQVGADLGLVLERPIRGKIVSKGTTDILDTHADLCVIATSSRVSEIRTDILLAVAAQMNVLSSSEELVYPWATDPDLAEELDRASRSANVTILGTGINPGYVMDMLPIVLSAVCRSVTSVEARRVNNLALFGPSVLQSFGIGLSIEEFEHAWVDGDIAGHVGFAQSVAMISDTLGLGVDRIEESMSPISAKRERRAGSQIVPPGTVAGIEQEACGYRGSELVVRLLHPQQVDPAAEGKTTSDYIELRGDPDVRVTIAPEIPGGIGTIAVMANSAPALLEAKAGLLTMMDLPVPHAFGKPTQVGGGDGMHRRAVPLQITHLGYVFEGPRINELLETT